MSSTRLGSLSCALLSAATLTGIGCTTNLKNATDAHQAGQFDVAAKAIDQVAPHETEADGDVASVKIPYDRDRFWVVLEKAKILEDHGDFRTSLELYEWVFNTANDRRKMESWYQENPAKIETWDAGAFLQQSSQAVAGADQTDYLLQPYEMILVNSYNTLDSLLADTREQNAFARRAQEVQELERKDLANAGEEVAQAPAQAVDQRLSTVKNSGIPQGFTMESLYQQTGFGAAQESMRAVVSQARTTRSADPRVASAYVTQWAAHMKARDIQSARSARTELASACGATALLAELQKFESNGGDDFVLVFVGAGKAPARDFFSIRLPVPVPNVGMGYFRGVYPMLRFRPEGRPTQLAVTADGRRTALEQVDSIDAIAARNFQRRELELWTIPTIRGVIRTAASLVAQAAARKNDQSGLGSLIALANIAIAEAEQADLRIWSTLPAAHHVAIVPRPTDGKLKIELSDGTTNGQVETTVGPGSTILYLRAITPTVLSKAFTAQLRPGAGSAPGPVPATDAGNSAPATDPSRTPPAPVGESEAKPSN
jgi:hypothetical protein